MPVLRSMFAVAVSLRCLAYPSVAQADPIVISSGIIVGNPAPTVGVMINLMYRAEEKRPTVGWAFSVWLSGGVLLSHTVPGAVPSALVGLASGFGMLPGVSPPP